MGGPRKARDRVLAKAASDYSKLEAPATSHVLDLVRCTAYFDDPLTLALCFSILKSLTDIVRVKNRFVNPAPYGYRDMMLNVRLVNGHVAEIQLGFDSLMILKEWMHPNYELVRPTNMKELIQVCRDRAVVVQGRPNQEGVSSLQGDLFHKTSVVQQAASSDDFNHQEAPMNESGQEEEEEVQPLAFAPLPPGGALVIAVDAALAAVTSDTDSVTSVSL